MFKEAIEAAKEAYKKSMVKDEIPAGWTLTKMEIYDNGKIGSKPKKFYYLEQPLGNGEVHVYQTGHVFVGCTDLEKKVFDFKTNRHKINELAEYVKERYNH